MSILEYEYNHPARKLREKKKANLFFSFKKSTFNKIYKEDALKIKRPAFKIHYFN